MRGVSSGRGAGMGKVRIRKNRQGRWIPCRFLCGGMKGDGCAPHDLIFPDEKSGHAHLSRDDAQLLTAARILGYSQADLL